MQQSDIEAMLSAGIAQVTGLENGHLNVNFIEPDTDESYTEALVAANSTAVQYSNQAVQAIKAGKYEESARLHEKALDLKLKAYSKGTVQAAISYNGLGEALLKAGKVSQADEALQSALQVRDDTANGGLGLGPRVDAAVTRENLAQVREAQGHFDKAKELRLKGDKKAEIVCANYDCPGMMYSKKDLKTCGNCRSVFYHDVKCQKQDWNVRHKVLCRARQSE